nr:unnamed protein product [Digitaria exilis]
MSDVDGGNLVRDGGGVAAGAGEDILDKSPHARCRMLWMPLHQFAGLVLVASNQHNLKLLVRLEFGLLFDSRFTWALLHLLPRPECLLCNPRASVRQRQQINHQ